MNQRRVVVTGAGVIAPCGIGTEAFWAGLSKAPKPGATLEVEGFEGADWFDPPKAARRIDRFAQFAIAATEMALDQAGHFEGDPTRTGVWIGSGVGGLNTLETQIQTFYDKGPRRVSPFLVPMMMSNAASAAVSMRHGWQGPCETTVTACAAGTHSISNAAMLVASGRCDTMITGGTESALTPTGIQGFANMTALSRVGASKPFDAERDGFVMAEGAGVLIIEALDTALARGATPIAEILGSASTADAHHITAPAPGGSGAVACMQLAMSQADLQPADVSYINAHGTSTPLNDAAEAEALVELFGASTGEAPGPPVTSLKGVTGHALGAAGAIEAVSVVLSMQHRKVPPTMGTAALDPKLAPINLVLHSPQEWTPGPTLSNSFGFGGHNGTLVLGPAD